MSDEQYIKKTLIVHARQERLHSAFLIITQAVTYLLLCHSVFILLDHTFYFEKTGRSLAFILTFLTSLIFAVLKFKKLFSQKINLIHIAQQLELNNISLQSCLLSYLMSRQKSSNSSHLVAQKLKQTQLQSPTNKNSLTLLKLSMLTAAFICLYGFISPQPILLSSARLYSPLSDLALPYKTQFEEILPRDNAVIFVQDNWTIQLQSSGSSPKSGFVRIYKTNNDHIDTPLVQEQEHRFHATLAAWGESLEYKIYLGDGHSKRRKVYFTRKPIVEDFSIDIKPPVYSSLKPKKSSINNITAFTASSIFFNFRFDQDIKEASIKWGEQTHKLTTVNHKVFNHTPLLINAQKHYSLSLKTLSNETHEYPVYSITQIKDKTPVIRLSTPKNKVTSDETIDLRYQLEDDMSLQEITLLYQLRFNKVSEKIILHKGNIGSFQKGIFAIDLKQYNILHDDLLVMSIMAKDQQLSQAGTTWSKPLLVEIKKSLAPRTEINQKQSLPQKKNQKNGKKEPSKKGSPQGSGDGDAGSSQAAKKVPTKEGNAQGSGDGEAGSSQAAKKVPTKEGSAQGSGDGEAGNSQGAKEEQVITNTRKNERQEVDSQEKELAERELNSKALKKDPRKASQIDINSKAIKKDDQVHVKDTDKLPLAEINNPQTSEEELEKHKNSSQDQKQPLSEEEVDIINSFQQELKRLKKP